MDVNMQSGKPKVPFGSLKVGDVFRTGEEFHQSRVRYAKIDPQPQTYNDGIWNAQNRSSKVKTYFPDERLVELYETNDPIKQPNGVDGETLEFSPEPPPPDTVRRYPPLPEENNEV
jgi:hypothetical protein